jgi:hypothetical protein
VRARVRVQPAPARSEKKWKKPKSRKKTSGVSTEKTLLLLQVREVCKRNHKRQKGQNEQETQHTTLLLAIAIPPSTYFTERTRVYIYIFGMYLPIYLVFWLLLLMFVGVSFRCVPFSACFLLCFHPSFIRCGWMKIKQTNKQNKYTSKQAQRITTTTSRQPIYTPFHARTHTHTHTHTPTHTSDNHLLSCTWYGS